MLQPKERQILSIIRTHWRIHGKAPTLRALQEELWYKSPRSAQLLVNTLVEKGFLVRGVDGKIFLGKEDTVGQMTIDIPLIGTVACGKPIFAEENIQAVFPVSTHIAPPPHKYFFLRAKGDSMNNAGVHDGDLVLIREQHVASDNEIVVALVDDEATIKRFRRIDDYIALIPDSTDESFKTMIVHENLLIQGIFVRAFPKSIF